MTFMPKREEIDQAVAFLKAGQLVGLPTETVYGLAGDASNPEAVARIFKAKGRPADNPLIVHVSGVEALPAWASEIPAAVAPLAAAFWPGPLTFVLKKQPWVSDAVTAGQPTVAVRAPAHPVAQAVLQGFGGGLAAPSANQFTHVSPTTADGVKEELGDQVALVLEGGACEVGLESTILDLSGDVPRILRPGMISQADIEAVLGVPVLMRGESEVRVPGQHVVHYAPRTRTCLIAAIATLEKFATKDERHVLITHQERDVPAFVELVVMPSEPAAYAHDLYRVLRELDAKEYDTIWIETVPDTKPWDAIRDRLNKAAVWIES